MSLSKTPTTNQTSVMKKKVLFVMTGSIAAYKACSVLSKLVQNNYEVKVVMTAGSLNFVGKSTIEGLTGNTPITDMYTDGQVMDHIHLDRWADLIIVAPATAHFINRIANGIGDDLLTTLFLAHDFKKPYLIAPAMNTMMYLHPTTQRSLKKLKELGIEILETASGVLACGEVGFGRLLEPDLIYQEIEQRLKTKASDADVNAGHTRGLQVVDDEIAKQEAMAVAVAKSKSATQSAVNILITSGGTTEPIDDVRVITNKSTGKTGSALTDYLTECGFNVTLLHSENSALPRHTVNRRSFVTFNDLQKSLDEELKSKSYDWVIHCAAVSDFSPEAFSGKISSDQSELHLKMIRNPKLVDLIKKQSPKTKLVAFKLTSNADQAEQLQKVENLISHSQADLVIHNDARQMTQAGRTFQIFKKASSGTKPTPATTAGAELAAEAQGVESLASYLFGFILERT